MLFYKSNKCFGFNVPLNIPPFSGWGIWGRLKIIDAGVLELADEADSKSVGLKTRAGSTPATGTTP